MITKEQILSGCEIWLAFNGKVMFSRYNLGRLKSDVFTVVPNDPDYHTSKYEAELHLLKGMLNN